MVVETRFPLLLNFAICLDSLESLLVRRKEFQTKWTGNTIRPSPRPYNWECFDQNMSEVY